MSYDIDDDTLVKAAREALTRPDSFLYFGSLPLFESWGMTISQNRDSDVLNRSNFRRMLEDAQGVATSQDGDNAEDGSEYVQVEHMSHWLCGWIEHIMVRVLIDEDGGVKPDNITETFKFLASVSLYLRDEYPVYDESDYSELENQECEAAFESAWNDVDWEEVALDGNTDDDIKWCVYRALTENETPDWFDYNDIRTAYVDAIQFQAYQEYNDRLTSNGQQISLFGHPHAMYNGFRGCLTCGNQWQH
jgi:hypothetical protein